MATANFGLTDDAIDYAKWREGPLQARPGFLIRRLHQIHSALFNEECGAEGITPIMYSVLSVLEKSSPIDQTSLAQSVAIDKTNMTDVLERLRKQGYVRRRLSTKDKRVRLTTLTDKGRALLDRVNDNAERAHIRTLEDLTASEQVTLVKLMNKIIAAKTPK
jgi:DNA-binding MarR family transcriptional regulator